LSKQIYKPNFVPRLAPLARDKSRTNEANECVIICLGSQLLASSGDLLVLWDSSFKPHSLILHSVRI